MGAIYLNGIKYGGGGGTEVVPNPEGEATSALEKLEVNGDIYSVGGATGDYMEKENPTGWGSLVSTSNTILDKDGNPTSAKTEGGMLLWGQGSTVRATATADGQFANAIVGDSHIIQGPTYSLIAGDHCTVVGGAYHTISGRGNAQVGGGNNISMIGYQSSATGNYNNVIGSFNHLLGAANYNTVIGDSSSANAGSQYCFTFGRGNAAASAENSSIIVGQNSTAQGGEHNEIFGKSNNLAGAKYNTVIGYQNSSYKNYNYSLGENNQTMLSHTVTIGSKNTIQGTAKDSYDSNANKGIIIGSKSTAILTPGTNSTPDNMIIGNNIFLNSTVSNNMVIGNYTTASNLGQNNIIIGTNQSSVSGLGYGNIVLAPYGKVEGGNNKINYCTIIANSSNKQINMSSGTHYGCFITGYWQDFATIGDCMGLANFGSQSTVRTQGNGSFYFGHNNDIYCTNNAGSLVGGWFNTVKVYGDAAGSYIGGYNSTVNASVARGSILFGSQSKLQGDNNGYCSFDRSQILSGYTNISAPYMNDSFFAGASHSFTSTAGVAGLTVSGVGNEPKKDYQTLIGFHLEGEDEYHQTIIGKYNAPATNTAFAIGNGTADNARSNAFTVDWDGNAELQGNLTINNSTTTINVGDRLLPASTTADEGKLLSVNSSGVAEWIIITNGNEVQY